jgi:predicted dehydrogenase
MNERPIRIGVAGVGFGATVHIPAFQSEGLEVVSVFSRRQERVDEASAKFGIANAYTDYETMLARDDLDAVSIVTPVTLHREMTLQALRAGKHVMCEKPFTPTEAEAKELYDAAEASGHTHSIAHEFRFASARMRAKELIDEGYIGDLRFVLMRMVGGGFGRPGAAGGGNQGPQPYVAERDSLAMGAGFLWGLGSHYIDALRHWFGEVESVSGDLVNFQPQRSDGRLADADDTFMFTLRFVNGGYAQMVASRQARLGSGATAEIYGSEGTLVTPHGPRGANPPPHGTLLGGKATDEALKPLEIPSRLEPFADDRDERLMPFRMLTREFVRGIRSGTSPAPNFHDGWRNQQVLDAVRESSRTGRRVTISG